MSAQPSVAPAPKDSATNTAGAKAAATERIMLIDIRVDQLNRKDHDPAALKTLAAQIKAEGLLQPIVVRPLTEKEMESYQKPVRLAYWPRYQIVAGERRYEAHRLLKLTHIEAKIIQVESDLAGVVKQTMENLSRADLNPMDEARQMKRLSDLRMPQAEIGKLFGGRSQPAVSTALHLLELPARVQEMVATGELEAAAGAELVRFAPWSNVCYFIAKRYLKTAWSAKDLRRPLPFESELVSAKLVIEICTEPTYYGEPKAVYTVPAALQTAPGFVKGYRCWYYLLPDESAPGEKPAPDLWAPEKEKQDQARAAKEVTEKKKAAEAAKKGGKAAPTKEQKERAAKQAKNKASRQLLAQSLTAAEERLNMVKDYDAPCVRVIALQALDNYQVQKQVEDAAKAIGVTLPKEFDENKLAHLAKLDPVDLLLVTATAVARMHAHYAHRDASDVPEEVRHLMKKAGGKGK